MINYSTNVSSITKLCLKRMQPKLKFNSPSIVSVFLFNKKFTFLGSSIFFVNKNYLRTDLRFFLLLKKKFFPWYLKFVLCRTIVQCILYMYYIGCNVNSIKKKLFLRLLLLTLLYMLKKALCRLYRRSVLQSVLFIVQFFYILELYES